MQRSVTSNILRRAAFIGVLLLVFVTNVMAADAAAGMKTGNMSLLYGITSALALILLIGYCCIVRQKELWFILLYTAVFVVNLGYFTLSISGSLGEAMLANRISYLGSVFLPLCMLMIIMQACHMRIHKGVLILLICISIATFLLAASGGYLDLYYKEVTVEFVGDVAVLKKVYGPLHGWYLIYLLSYFALMVGTILYASIKKRIGSIKHATILASLVLGNIAVWYVEQLINWNFEFLSVTYLITELLLLLLSDMLEDYERLRQIAELPAISEIPLEVRIPDSEPEHRDSCFRLTEEQIAEILTESPAVTCLTSREKEVLESLLYDLPRREIAAKLYVTENTVKKHTSNIFSKLEVSNRKELFAKLNRAAEPCE